MTLTEVFTSTAEAIRQKTGKSNKIKPINFASEIATITGGSGTDTSDATATAADILSGKTAYIKNGRTTGTMPNNGLMNKTFDGINKKSVSIPAGYTYGGVVGLDDTIDNTTAEQTDLIARIIAKVNSLPNVSGGGDGSEVLLQEKTITENGTYIPDSGFDGFSKVNVNVAGSGEQPTLFTPAITVHNATNTLTIIDDQNGSFVEGYDLYANHQFATTLSNKTTTLTDYMENDDSIIIYVQAKATHFNSSEFSNTVEWVALDIDGTPGLIYEMVNSKYARCSGMDEFCIASKIEFAFTYNDVPVTQIGSSAFENNTQIQSVIIHDGITAIHNDVFRKCSALTSVKFGQGLKSISSYAFAYCTSLLSITLPDSVTQMSSYVFYNCSMLTEVILSASLTEIPYYGFRSCKNLQSISIPDSVTYISGEAFADCTSLVEVIFGSSVNEIANYAFAYCTNLKYLDFSRHTTIPNLLHVNAFNRVPSNVQIKVPSNLINEWKKATNWLVYADNIVEEFDRVEE